MRKLNWKYYVLLASIGSISFLLTWLVRVDPIFKGLIALPGTGALLGILWDIVRNHNDYLRKIELQERGQEFDLATASHMANCVFDKHAQFSEEYMSKITETIRQLSTNGPNKEVLLFAVHLADIRQKYTAWLTKEIDGGLERVEKAFRSIGADEHLLESLPTGDKRSEIVNRVYKRFEALLGLQRQTTDQDAQERDVAYEEIVEFIRNLLGTSELTMMRKVIVKATINRVKRIESNS